MSGVSVCQLTIAGRSAVFPASGERTTRTRRRRATRRCGARTGRQHPRSDRSHRRSPHPRWRSLSRARQPVSARAPARQRRAGRHRPSPVAGCSPGRTRAYPRPGWHSNADNHLTGSRPAPALPYLNHRCDRRAAAHRRLRAGSPTLIGAGGRAPIVAVADPDAAALLPKGVHSRPASGPAASSQVRFWWEAQDRPAS
jgi:hypothetical protein